MAPSENRRRHPRVAVELKARMTTVDPRFEHDEEGGSVEVVEARCVDLSSGGSQVDGGPLWGPGRKVLLELRLPGGREVGVVGVVAWSRVSASDDGAIGARLGLAFAEPAPEQVERYLHKAAS